MKLPEKIKGIHKVRDGAIVLYFKRDNLDFDELGEKFKLTERRIRQILAKNHAFIKRDKQWEKEKRILRLAKRLKDATPTKKDELDILAELRKEIEGDGIKIKQVGTEKHLHITNVNFENMQQEELINLLMGRTNGRNLRVEE